MKKRLEYHEAYPVIIVSERGNEYEIPDELWNEFVSLGDQFAVVERKMFEVMEAQDVQRRAAAPLAM